MWHHKFLDRSHIGRPDFGKGNVQQRFNTMLDDKSQCFCNNVFIQMKQNVSLESHQLFVHRTAASRRKTKEKAEEAHDLRLCCFCQRFPWICAGNNKDYEGSLEWHLKVWASSKPTYSRSHLNYDTFVLVFIPLNTLSVHSQSRL